MTETTNKIYLPKWAYILYGLSKGLSMQEIHFKKNISYPHVLNITKEMESKRWISMEKQGRDYKIKLEFDGNCILDCIIPLMHNLKKKRKVKK